MKIFQILGLANPIDGDFGIEIEAEGEGMNEVNNRWWKTVDDGSLRGAYPESRAEFILAQPIKMDLVKPTIKQLLKSLPNAQFKFSFRTSVHVHVNVQDMEFSEMLAFIYTYLLLEEPLVHFAGKERKGNRFCLRLQDAEGILDTLNILFRYGKDGLGHINKEQIRYASVNIGALLTYGSLEFRAMKGNIDPEFIGDWCALLHRVREFAREAKDPETVFDAFSRLGAGAFLNAVLGDLSPKVKYAKMEEDLARSFSLSIDLPHTYVQFQKPKEKVAVKKVKQGQGIKLGQGVFINQVFDPAMLERAREIIEAHPGVQIREQF